MKKLIILAFILSICSCNRTLSIESKKFIKDNTNIQEIIHFNLPNWRYLDVIVTEDDTITIYSVYKCGSVVIERKPVLK